MVVAEAELARRAEHPVGPDAGHLAAADLHPVGHGRADGGQGHEVASRHVERAAADLQRLAVAGVDDDLVDLVGALDGPRSPAPGPRRCRRAPRPAAPCPRRPSRGRRAGRPARPDRPRTERSPATKRAGPSRGTPSGGVGGGRGGQRLRRSPPPARDGSAGPSTRLSGRGRTVTRRSSPKASDDHQNWVRKRMSLVKRSRRSSTPWRLIASRSRPKPNAKPCHSSGSMPAGGQHVGVDHPAPAQLEEGAVGPDDVVLGRRLGEGEVGRAEAGREVAAEVGLGERVEGAGQVGEGDVAVDDQPLDLVEHRHVGGVGGVLAEHPAGHDRVEGRLAARS